MAYSDLQSKARADELLARYHTSHSVADIEGAIGAYEETERLRPVGHENRADSLNDLGDALYHFCWHHEPDEIRGIRCIEVLREALRLRPPGHPLRDQSLHILARSLYFVLYPKVGSLDVLRESASLSREALRLRPPGHSERAASMNSLANDLERTVVEHTGDMDMLAEVTSMRREILRMHPPGDPWRQHALSNLGGTLSFTFEHLGGSDLLAEAISVAREAMQLHPAGHPRRFATLNTLGSVLTFRYTYEGNSESLLEAVDCRREALRNQPDCHPERARLMHNLAESLLASFRHSGDGKALAEAISLYRKVVTQATPEAYTHDDALYSLAEALIAKYGNDHDRKALSEATDLYREALKLRPVGHVRRFLALEGMALVLSQIEPPSWPQALSCYQEALQLCPIGYPARARLLSGMSRCFLEIKSPLFSLSEGTSCLSDAYADTYSHVSGRLKLAIPDLQQLEIAYGVSTEIHRPGTHQENAERVLNIYTQVIGLLPLAANFGLNHSARLRALTGYDVIARDAAARAVIHGVPSQAVEILEQGRGVFWTQTLHLRTTAFDGVPEADREELQRMLRLLEHGARRAELQDQSIVQNERELEERRQLNKAVQTLITQIRGHPGLDRFLLPPAFDALLGSLPDGYVVIVNASKLGHHALLLYRPTGLATSLALTRFAAGCDYAKLRTQLPRDLMSGCGEEGGFEIRAMRIDNGRVADLEDALALLWVSIGLPVVETLGLPVSDIILDTCAAFECLPFRKRKDLLGPDFGGP
jgi:tetratricopeptide (TPR) repeat protein